MKKKLLRTLLFGLFLFIVSKAFIAFSAYQSISALKDHYKHDFLLTYGWISSTWNGSVSIEDIELTPYAMKKTFSLERVTLQYADYLSLVTQLPSIKDGSIEQLKSISIPHIQSGLTGKSINELLVEQWGGAWLTPFDVYGCGGLHKLTPENYQGMGINQWDASLEIAIEKNNKGADLLAVMLDQKELGRLNVVSEWSPQSIDSIAKLQNLSGQSLLSLDVEHQDAGFFRRLNILCNKGSVEKRRIFSTNAALDWKNTMYSQGLVLSDNLVVLYNNYLLQGGALSVTAKREGGFQFNNKMALVNKELIKYFQMTLNLNGQELNTAELYVDGSILFPPEKEPEIEVLPLTDLIKFEPGYKRIDLEFVDQHIGRKIRVSMLTGKEYEGILRASTEYNLELTQNLPGGVVNYPLMLNEINTFEVWINQE